MNQKQVQHSTLKIDKRRDRKNDRHDLKTYNFDRNYNSIAGFCQKIFHPRWTIARKLGASYLFSLSIAAVGIISGISWGDYYEQKGLNHLTIANTQNLLLADLDRELGIVQTQPQKILRALGKPLLSEYERTTFSLQIKHIQEQLSTLFDLIETYPDRVSIDPNRYKRTLQRYQEILRDYEKVILALWQDMEAIKLTDERIPQAQQNILSFMQGEENRQLEIQFSRLSENLNFIIKSAKEQRGETTLQLERSQTLRLYVIISSIAGSLTIAALLSYASGRAITDEYHQKQQEQIQLIQDEKMAGLSKMVGGVAHEINNPLGFIHTNLYYVERFQKDLLALIGLYQREYPETSQTIQDYLEEIEFDFWIEDADKVLNSMRVGTDRIRSIVTSLRNFSRLDESGRKAIDLHEGIESTLLVLSSRLQQGIQVQKKYGNLPQIECYPAQLNQVFLNVLTNSIDSLEEIKAKNADFQAKIHISTEHSTNNTIQIIVKDNGKGIPSEIQQKIFDPFFTTKPIGKGTGLGLSICYKIVEEHHGKITMNSEADRGTIMIISLPLSG